MEFNDTALSTLLDLDDDVGFLTVTVGVDDARRDGEALRIWLKNELRDLRDHLDEDVHARLERRLDRHATTLDALIDPRTPGQGRALVMGVDSDADPLVFRLQTPFAPRVRLRARPALRPLVAALDEGRPAGVVIATKAGARVLEWSASTTRQLSEHTFELMDDQTGRDGGGASMGAYGAMSSNHRDDWDDRVAANRARFLKEVASVVHRHTRARDWDRIVVAGSTRIRDQIADLVDTRAVTVHDVPDHWEDHSVGQVAAAVWPVLRSSHAARERALTAQIREVALSGGPAAMGTRRVARAASQGRVDHLVFGAETTLEGYVADDGTLLAEVGGPQAQGDAHLTPVAHFVERIVERVLRTGGSVTRLDDDEAQRDLAAWQTIGALLRW